jgi:hypothetical protein
MPLSDYYPEMKGWTPVENPLASPLPQLPTPEVQVSPYLRTALPLPLIYTPDTLKQSNRPGLSSYRLSPQSPSSFPAINSAANSAVKKQVATVVAAAPPSSDVESIAVNVQNSTAYTVLPTDNNTVISLTNNLGGTVLLPPVQSGTWSFRQTYGLTAYSSPQSTVSMSAALIKGDLVVIAIIYQINEPLVSVTDTLGNTWLPVPGANASNSSLGPQFIKFFYTNVKTGGNSTISVLFMGTVNFPSLSGVAFTPPGNASALLDQAAGTTNGNGIATTPTIVTTAAAEALWAVIFTNNHNPTPGAGWTRSYQDTFTVEEYQITTVAGSYTGTQTSVVSDNYNGSIASFTSTVGVVGALPEGFYTYIENTGTGTFIVTSGVKIDGSLAGVTVGPNQGLLFVFDGSGWRTVKGLHGAPPTDTYVLGTPDTVNLPNSVANPTAYYGADTAPTVAGSVDDEFNGISLAGSWIIVNQGSATIAVSNSLVQFHQPTHAGDSQCLIVKTAPTPPYSITAKISMMPATPETAGFGICGLCFRESSTGKIVRFNLDQEGTTGTFPNYKLAVLNFTNPTTFSSAPLTISPWYPCTSWFYMRVKDDGTNFIFFFSQDGVQFFQIFSVSRTSFFSAPNQVGFVFDAGNGATGDLYCSMDYFRQT